MGTISLQIPQTGLPNSTEDPKIASDFTTVQTVINGNIDTNNLKTSSAGITRAQLAVGASYPNSTVNVATNTSAAYGQLVVCENALTVALPAVLRGALVAIFNVTTATVTINPPGGATIFLPGTGSVASAVMSGTVSQCWTFMSDGANWLLAATNQL